MAEIDADSNAQLRWPEKVTKTTDPAVDAVISPLAGLSRLPTAEHVVVYDSIHGKLRQELDAGPDGDAEFPGGTKEGGA
ncbi:hypothetical protein IV500_14455 [Paeniglutamicibacter antarcticus]|uniref:Uncharacterized protein n=1 Tax=Arthrobacter terrae TaxID=2935737 RepID=A0A931CQA2_9MICC|nr:hypothetical protein [Arthrobacter terrae]MBG0740580.1 hypothetical protein [Arthrobacter terrae]